MSIASPLLHWLASSSADVAGRALLQVGATVMFTRWLGPEAFGTATLVAVQVGFLSLLGAAVFEEALVQRRVVRKAHFEAALAALLPLVAVLWLAALLLANALAPAGAAGLSPALIAGYALIVPADGWLSVQVALARRQRRFADIARANLVGLTVGTAVGLLVAAAGGGVAGLLAVQPLARAVSLATLLARTRVSLRPRWASAPLRDLLGFGGYSLAARLVEGAGDLLFQSLVARLFGVAGNGYLNMAMRVVEPIRGATSAIGHNLAMTGYARAQAMPAELGRAVQATIAESALLLLPMFAGLAVTAPLIIAVIGGPAWAPAAPIAVGLALAAAIGSVTNFLHGAVAASGRADLGLVATVTEALALNGALLLLAPFGLPAAGLARIGAWLLDAALVSRQAGRLIGLRVADWLAPLLPVAASALLMALATAGVIAALQAAEHGAGLSLALAIASGLLVYAGLLLGLHRARLRAVLARLRR